MTDPALLAAWDHWFRVDPDPWSFETSNYEQARFAAILRACGRRDDARILELGAANGVLASLLADGAATLTAIEAVPAAARLARRRLQVMPHATVIEGLIPDAVPTAQFEIVVASEILYYLGPDAYARTLRRLERWIAADGRLVAVHWRPTGPERPRSALRVHEDLAALPFLQLRETADTDDYLLSVLEPR